MLLCFCQYASLFLFVLSCYVVSPTTSLITADVTIQRTLQCCVCCLMFETRRFSTCCSAWSATADWVDYNFCCIGFSGTYRSMDTDLVGWGHSSLAGLEGDVQRSLINQSAVAIQGTARVCCRPHICHCSWPNRLLGIDLNVLSICWRLSDLHLILFLMPLISLRPLLMTWRLKTHLFGLWDLSA